jgi:uncharacterized UPF0146 family protein
MQAEHCRVRRILRHIDRRGTGHKLRLVQDEIVDPEEASPSSVKVVHRDNVLVIVRPGHRLVRKMVRISDHVEIESAGWIVAGRDGDLDLVCVDVDDGSEPPSTASVKADLRIRE